MSSALGTNEKVSDGCGSRVSTATWGSGPDLDTRTSPALSSTSHQPSITKNLSPATSNESGCLLLLFWIIQVFAKLSFPQIELLMNYIFNGHFLKILIIKIKPLFIWKNLLFLNPIRPHRLQLKKKNCFFKHLYLVNKVKETYKLGHVLMIFGRPLWKAPCPFRHCPNAQIAFDPPPLYCTFLGPIFPFWWTPWQ